MECGFFSATNHLGGGIMWMSEKDFQFLLARNPALKVHQTYYKKERAPNAKVSAQSEFDSEAERRYYYKVIYPAIRDGTVTKVTLHKKFELLPSAENNGKKYRAIHYSPDFFVEYRNGRTEVVEIKGRQIRKMRPDYPIRRLLFITNFCNPNEWHFVEVFDDEI